MTDLNKDLLQEVIGKEYKILKITKHSITVIHEEAFNSVDWCEHKVAHMCKEWVLSKGYYFSIYSFNFSFNTEQEHRIRLLIGNEVVYWGDDSCEETEPEAIFKATQWIPNNKDLT